MEWIERKTLGPDLSGSKVFGQLSPLLQGLISCRVQREEDLPAFLDPRLASLDDPFRITNLKEGAERIVRAIQQKEKVLIYGDYDVDGVTSAVVLMDVLQRFGLKPHNFVPNRSREGYGISAEALDRALDEITPDLLIAVDCGTSSATDVRALREKGIDVVIIDHHKSKEDLPENCLLINPHVYDRDSEPWYNLCSVGLVFKVVHGVIKLLREENNPTALKLDLREFLDLVALGTVADIVPLHGENRIFVNHGLKRMASGQRPGLLALMQQSGIDPASNPDTFDLGFRLGPRINASGRLEDANAPIRLLLEKNYSESKTIARQLDELNQKRQAIEKKMSKMAEKMAGEMDPSANGFVLADSDWHSGVVGIVASRIARSFHKPSLVLGCEEDSNIFKGSGRSIEGIDLVEVLKRCESHLEQWGGHPMAVGVSVKESEIDHFRKAFVQAIEDLYGSDLPDKRLYYDCEVRPEDLSSRMLDELDQLEPYGENNPRPVFILKGVAPQNIQPVGNGHLRFRLNFATSQVGGIYWNGSKKPFPANQAVDLAFRFSWNYFRGNKTAQVSLLDWRA